MKKHFVPKGEEKNHNASMTCECRPAIVVQDGQTVAVHKSVTGLEQVYGAKKILGLNPKTISLVEIKKH